MQRRKSLKSYPLASCAALILLAAAKCPPSTPGACERPDRHTLVFFDQSASSVTDASTSAMFRDSVNALLGDALECNGDAVHGFLVHGNTRGKVNRADVSNSLTAPDTVNVPSIKKARALSRYKGEMDSIRADGATRLSGLLTASVSPQFKRHTDLLGTLEVVSDQVAQAQPGSTVVIYYLGDMHESMPSPRRNFDARPPASTAEAEAWADADTALLSGMKFDRERLANAEVRVLLGNLANKPGAPEVRAYWERLFANVGVQPGKIRYN